MTLKVTFSVWNLYSSLSFYLVNLREAFQNQTNAEKILYGRSLQPLTFLVYEN